VLSCPFYGVPPNSGLGGEPCQLRRKACQAAAGFGPASACSGITVTGDPAHIIVGERKVLISDLEDTARAYAADDDASFVELPSNIGLVDTHPNHWVRRIIEQAKPNPDLLPGEL
jgi:hypothetical protein